MKSFFRTLRDMRFSYEPLVEVLIFRDAILHNLHAFQKAYPQLLFAPVLKANAYGHGLAEVGGILKDEDIPFLVIDSYYEALILRNEGIQTPILIIGYTDPINISKNKLADVSFTITSLHQLETLLRTLDCTISVHVKFDTGMHRQGIELERSEEVIALCKDNPQLRIDGICSHLADADGKDSSFSLQQVERWNRLVASWKKSFPKTRYFHLAATAGKRFVDAETNVIRLGRGLYGYDIAPVNDLQLQPALEMKTILTGIRQIDKEEKVGYNCTFEASETMTIATVPVGYYEGLDRRLSNKGYMTVAGVECQIIGRVSMNMSTIDVSGVSNVQEGDEVVVISRDRGKKNSLLEIAHSAETIGHEILVHIPSALRRVVV